YDLHYGIADRPGRLGGEDRDEDKAAISLAKRVCNGDQEVGIEPCPVRARCLQTALDNGETHGVWGGLDPDGRSPPATVTDTPTQPAAEPETAPAPRVSECKYGHPMHGDNVRIGNGKRYCRECKRRHVKEYRDRKAARLEQTA